MSRICSTVRARDSRSRGLATTKARHIARDGNVQPVAREEELERARQWHGLRAELVHDLDVERVQRLERGVGYIVIEAGRRLLGFGIEARESRVGIVLTAVSSVVMPLLGMAKLQVARELGSGAMRADAYETMACAWLSLTTLAGLLLNAALGWWWADPLAALAIVPLVIREGLEGWRSEPESGESS